MVVMTGYSLTLLKLFVICFSISRHIPYEHLETVHEHLLSNLLAVHFNLPISFRAI
jgi:hypothetical protein